MGDMCKVLKRKRPAARYVLAGWTLRADAEPFAAGFPLSFACLCRVNFSVGRKSG